MGTKQDFITALLEMPVGVKPVIVGEVTEISMPSDKDNAMIAVGQFAANMNNALLKPLAGLDIAELLLHSGERSSVQVSALLSRLEVIADKGSKLKVLSPLDGALVEPDVTFMCKGDGITAVLVTIEGWGEIELAEVEKVWAGQATDEIAAGNYAASFKATFGDDSTAEASVSFTVKETEIILASVPEDGASYMPADLTEFSVAIKDDVEVSSVTFSAFGQQFSMQKSASGNIFTTQVDANSSFLGLFGAQIGAIDVETNGEHRIKSFSFTLFAGDEPDEPDPVE